MLPVQFTCDPRTLAHCRLCHEPMYCIYDSAIRDYCHLCLEDIRHENAKDILGVR